MNQYFQDAQTTAKLIEVLEKGLLQRAGGRSLRIAKFSFQQGAASLLEVLDAQRVQRQTPPRLCAGTVRAVGSLGEIGTCSGGLL